MLPDREAKARAHAAARLHGTPSAARADAHCGVADCVQVGHFRGF